MIIDTHIHLYDPLRPEGVPWPDADDETLYQTTRADRFLGVALPAGIDGAIIVECSPWVEDNQWVLDLAREEPHLLGLVGNLDLNDDAFADRLDRFARDPLFRGIRGRPRDPSNLEGVRRLADRGLSLDCGMGEHIAPIAEAVPALRIIINHCAGIKMDGADPDPAASERVRLAATFPNVYCKLSGMMDLRCTIRPAPTDVAHYAPYLDLLWDAFGEDRMIFGSDWPVSDRSERTYADILRLAEQYVATKPASARAKVFADNARAAYDWPTPSPAPR